MAWGFSWAISMWFSAGTRSLQRCLEQVLGRPVILRRRCSVGGTGGDRILQGRKKLTAGFRRDRLQVSVSLGISCLRLACGLPIAFQHPSGDMFRRLIAFYVLWAKLFEGP